MDTVKNRELSVILFKQNETLEDDSAVGQLLSKFLHGEFEEVLSHSVGEKLLRDNLGNKQHLDELILSNVEKYLVNTDGNRDSLELEVLLVGAACLHLFIQNNWTGPLTDQPATAYLCPAVVKSQKALSDFILEDLSLDGAPVYGLARHIALLYVARVIFLDCRKHFTTLLTSDWWLMRCIGIHQDLLEEKSPTLKETVLDIMESVSTRENLLSDDEHKDSAVLFHLEAGHLCHTYYEYKRSREHFAAAKKLSGLEIGLTGALGKRTKFQQDAKAQLMLEVSRQEGACQISTDTDTDKHIPKNIPLDDDTVLDGVNLTERDQIFCVCLSQLEQAVVYGCMESYKRSVAIERLTEEEILTYVVGLIDQMTSWCVGTTCLALRSKLQWDSRRRVERSMNQYEELVNQMGRNHPPVCHRHRCFFASKMPNMWTLQKDLATLLLSLGLMSEGLVIYERLQMWEEAIACYQQMGKLEKAETLIKQQLAVKETANLYCFLGDCTRRVEHYQQAWDLSKGRSARAMRCMGYLHFGNKDYKEAMECFGKSLEVNSLQIPVWFTYGCTAMTMQKYEEACRAFRRCVGIENDNYEAWANLSTCLVKLKQIPAAFKVLGDAIKCNYENWRLWDNFIVIGSDCGEFQDVIRGYNRLIDLKEKWKDVEVLKILVQAVTENLPDAAGRDSSRLRPKLQELFGRVTATVTNEGDIWRLYSKLISSVENPDHTTSERALQYLQKAHRCVMQTTKWEKDVDLSVKVTAESQHLALEYLKFADRCEPAQAITALSSAKLSLKTLIVKIKQEHEDPVSQTLPEKMQVPVSELSASLDQIVSKLEQLKGS